MKKYILIIVLLVFILKICSMFYSSEITIYKELYLKIKNYNRIEKHIDTLIYDLNYYLDTIEFDTSYYEFYNSDLYKFKYQINLGKYDSVYYFGEYPSLCNSGSDEKIYNAFIKKYYSGLFYSLNMYLEEFTKNHYVVYAVYKEGRMKFIKTKYMNNNISINNRNIMLRSGDICQIEGVNYKQKDGSIMGYISISPID